MEVFRVEGIHEEGEECLYQEEEVELCLVCPKIQEERMALLTEILRFGTIHLVLQLIPVLNMFFLITTAAGSGLYAADEEARRLQEIEAQRQPEGQYTDDPL